MRTIVEGVQVRNKGCAVARSAMLAALGASLLSPPAWSAIGRTPGTAGVTPAGEASYEVPIRATPGVAGLNPELSIAYASSGTRGAMGAGFTIAGLSAITPCARTISQDGVAAPITLTANDVYCVDGQRLRLISGAYGTNNARYRTEIDRAMRVTSLGTSGKQPTSFRIERANGLIYDYGATPDSRARSSSSANAVTFIWALNRVADRSGNAITFRYQNNPDEQLFRPDHIDYTATAMSPGGEYRIDFVYQAVDRPDPVEQSTPSSSEIALLKERRLLSRIDLRYQGATYRQYLFTYETGANATSRLTSIKECAASAGDCLSPTTFTWQSATPGYDAAAASAASFSLPAWPLDINGDGFEDLVWAKGGTWRTMLGGAGGYGAPVNTGIAAVNPARALPLEWNGDGRVDLLVDWSDGQWRVLKGTATGLASPVAAGAGGVTSDPASSWTVGDLDGDGRDDLVRASPPRYFHSWSNSVTGFTYESVRATTMVFAPAPIAFSASLHGTTAVRRVDFDADGREDLVAQGCEWDVETRKCLTQTGWWVFLADGTQLDARGMLYGSASGGAPVFGDFNADNMTDVAYERTDGTIGIAMARGRAGFSRLAGPSTAGYVASELRVADYDGDGYDDLLMASAAASGTSFWHVFRGIGSGVSTDAIATTVPGSSTVVADVDGDALPDLARVSANGTWTWHARTGVPGDLLASATDGFGVTALWTREPMSSTFIYTRGTGAVYPTSDLGGTRPLVSRLRRSDGTGTPTKFDVTYTYEAARIDREGRGALGFAARTLLDGRMNYDVGLRETYVQTFPHVGLLAARTLKRKDGTTVNEVANTWSAVTAGTPRVDERRLPYLAASVVRDYSAGVLFRTTAHDVDAVDATSGLVLDQTTTVTENATGDAPGASRSVRLQNTALLNDTTSWCIGRPTAVQLRASTSAAGGAAIVRTYKQSWDATACRVTQSQLQPGDAKLQVTTNLEYDSFGNVASQKVIGIGMPVRTTTVGWGPLGQYPETVTNALSQSALLTWDPTLGVPLTTKDPNLLTTIWDYDSFGRIVSERRPDGTSTTWSRDPCASCDVRARYQLVERQVGAGTTAVRAATTELDRHERPFRTTIERLYGGSAVAALDFDPRGRVSARRVPAFVGGLESGTWRYKYDELDRIRSEELVRPAGSSERSTVFDYDGLQTRVTDPLGRASVAVVSAWGDIVRVTDANNRSTSYQYDAFGNPTRVVDPLGNQVTAITYNVSGGKVAQADMDLGSWTFELNALGEVTKVRDAKTASPNWTTVRTYDLLGRLTSRQDVPDGVTATFVHGSSAAGRNIGQLESMSVSDGSYAESFTYDSVGRLARRRIVADATYDYDYAYNEIGLLKSLKYPASNGGYRLTIGYEHSNGYLTRIVDQAPTPDTEIWRAAALDAEARPIDERVGANVQVVTSIDAALGLIEGRTAGISGTTTIQDLAYAWDESGRLTSRTDGNQLGLTETFAYDVLGRLDKSWRNGTLNLDVAYDAAGNITSKFEEGLGTNAYQYHATRKHAAVSAGSSTYTYDANGNMVNRNGSAISWYSHNLPKNVAASGGSSQFWYGPDRRRWRQVATLGSGTETTIYVGGLMEKVTKSGTTAYRHYIPTPGSASALYVRNTSGTPATATYYLLTDHLGSLDNVVDAAGATVTVATSYSAFGRRRGPNWSGSPTASQLARISTTTRDGFTGHEMLDGSGLVHMNGRVYDPSIGRFLSPDPFVPSPYNSQSLNRYSYVGNDPLSLTDPSGFSPADDARPSLLCDDFCVAWYTASFQYGYVPFWPFGNPNSPDYRGTFILQPAEGSGVPVPPGGSPPLTPKEPRWTPNVAPFSGLAADSVSASQAYLCARAAMCAQRGGIDYDQVVTVVAAVGDVLLGIGTLGIVDGAEYRRVMDIGSVDVQSNAYEAGSWGAVFATAGLGKMLTTVPPAASAATTAELLPAELARAIPGRRLPSTLGPPGKADVFVTAADDIVGLNAAQIAERLTIDPADSFTVIRFPTPPTGVASPVFRTNPGFAPGGHTRGGAREYVIPNGPIPAGSKIEVAE